MENILKEYQGRINENNLQRAEFRVFQKYFPLSRLISFIGSGFLLYFAVATQSYIFVVALIVVFFVFLMLGWLDIKYKAKINRLDILNEINRNEINCIGGDYSGNETGDEFTDINHPYTFDLDIFGNKSLFQCINRTSTVFGKHRLAEYLRNAYYFSKDSLQRREAMRELSKSTEFRHELILIFKKVNTCTHDIDEMTEWINHNPVSPKRLNFFSVALYVFNIITVASVAMYFAGIVPANIFWIPAVVQLLIAGNLSRRFMRMHDVASKKFGILGKYSQSLELIEKTEFISDYLKNLKTRLTNNGSQKPGRAVKNLFLIINFMDSNFNFLLAIFTNGLFALNLHLAISVEKWKNSYRTLIPKWFEILGEIEAVSSLGNFAFNNPEYIYPEVAESSFVFFAEGMGHPLIDKNVCVKNNFTIPSLKNISIITGANMSGKSTLLRTVGINYILAMTGAPVCATSFVFTPVELHTSMRTNDNLSRRESYFYAELKRLKEIIDDLEKGSSKLILLDEILKGTNSVDKRNGSMALIGQLTRYNMAAVVATHDQVLGELKNNYPANISTLCFEISIVKDTMHIDYKLRNGICRNLNATYLMKNMGIIFEK